MSSKSSKTVKTSGLIIVNPAASPGIKTRTSMPFDPTPITVYNGQPVQPLTTPSLRQITPSKSVRIINPKAGQ